jgi:hypothetical protein
MKVRQRKHLREAQKLAWKFILKVRKCAVFGDIGIGKSGATITALRDLVDNLAVFQILIIAPKDVVRATWPDAFAEWQDAQEFTYEVLWGAKPGFVHHSKYGEQRLLFWEKKTKKLHDRWIQSVEDDNFTAKSMAKVGKCLREYRFAKRVLKWGQCAARRPADIHLVNRENVVWLVQFWGNYWPYDCVVYDESSDLKNGQRVLRWRAMRKVIPHTKRMIQLTGTPTPKGLIDLWGPMYVIDQGARLGNTLTKFREDFFDSDYMGYKYEPKPDAMEEISDRLKDVCLTLNAEDFMDLPETIYNPIPVVLDDPTMEAYRKFEKEYVMELEGTEIEAVNEAVLSTKLFQLANGTVYGENRQVRFFHAAKLDALDNYIEEMRGHNVLIAYYYKHDLARIVKRFPKMKVFNKDLIKPWNKGKIAQMLVHPQSAGHGINIQFGGRRILWYGPIPNRDLELYQQLNGRLAGARAVGLGTTFIDHLVAKNTQDQLGMEVLQGKAAAQRLFRERLKRLTKDS